MNERLAGVALPVLGVLMLAAITVLYLFARFAVPPTNEPESFWGSITETNDPLLTKVTYPNITEPERRPDDIVYGDAAAPVAIIVYSDFACPYCALMSRLLLQAVDETPDVVHVVWRDFPVTSLHAGSAEAHVAAACANAQGKFWEYHNRLFATAMLDQATLLENARALDLNIGSFTRCRDSNESKTQVLKNIREGDALGIDGTPYLFVGDQRISGLLSAEELRQVITLHHQLTTNATP